MFRVCYFTCNSLEKKMLFALAACFSSFIVHLVFPSIFERRLFCTETFSNSVCLCLSDGISGELCRSLTSSIMLLLLICLFHFSVLDRFCLLQWEETIPSYYLTVDWSDSASSCWKNMISCNWNEGSWSSMGLFCVWRISKHLSEFSNSSWICKMERPWFPLATVRWGLVRIYV